MSDLSEEEVSGCRQEEMPVFPPDEYPDPPQDPVDLGAVAEAGDGDGGIG